MDRAGTALADTAAEFSAGLSEVVADNPQQGCRCIPLERYVVFVEPEFDHCFAPQEVQHERANARSTASVMHRFRVVPLFSMKCAAFAASGFERRQPEP